ncbi:uncharacterized protein LOC125824032 [Solanum verrucosum]|uniref:uncharacterized protein LOC125824032 n=1 Tax=Solanum verrucosum TaxID=315347 RepID=UPI0020D19C73|nr:uncharacterized protein LOC125824032 [Solanum verrucosum]
MDLDLALLNDKPTSITDKSSEDENAREYLKFVEERFHSADKSLAGTLMAELTTIKFDGSSSMQNHIIKITNIAARLRTLGMKVDDNFLVQFILNSLPLEYGPFQINYNTIKDKRNVSELSSILIQEESKRKNKEVIPLTSWVKELVKDLK